jgi:hypothetical protein
MTNYNIKFHENKFSFPVICKQTDEQRAILIAPLQECDRPNKKHRWGSGGTTPHINLST